MSKAFTKETDNDDDDGPEDAPPLPAGTNPYFLFATQGSLASANSNAIEIQTA